MIALKKQVVTAISVGAMLLATAAPAVFADTNVSGNGAFSRSNVRSSQNNSATFTQRNTTNVSNNVNVRGNTGNNNASFNTGGDTSIQTGSTNAEVSIENTAGQNTLDLGGLSNGGYQNYGMGDVWVNGNGAYSNNRVNQNSRNTLRVSQNNNTNFRNNVNIRGNTGNNRSSFNTGGQTLLLHGKGLHLGGGNNSDNQIFTGDTQADVMIDNVAGSNQLGL